MTRDSALRLLHVTGAFGLARILHSGEATIAMYHRFAPDAPGALDLNEFRAQVAYLREHYQVVSLSELARRLQGQRRHWPTLPLAAITIDDGYQDCYEYALPVLREAGVPATVFLTTGFIDGANWLWPDKIRYLLQSTSRLSASLSPFGVRPGLGLSTRLERDAAAGAINAALKCLPPAERDGCIARLEECLELSLPPRPTEAYAPLRWEQVATLEEAGVEIGAHTVTHPILTRLSPADVRREVSGSVDRLEAALKHRVESFCYPNGDHDATVRDEVRRAGCTAGVTTTPGLNTRSTDIYALRRLPTAPDVYRFAKSCSGLDAFSSRLSALLRAR